MTLLLAAGLTLSHVALAILGWLIARVRYRQTKPSPCGCGHALAFHDLAASECKRKVQQPVLTGRYEETRYDWEQCACQTYTGAMS